MEMSDRENRSVLCSAAQGKESGFPQERWERLPGGGGGVWRSRAPTAGGGMEAAKRGSRGLRCQQRQLLQSSPGVLRELLFPEKHFAVSAV